MLGSSHGGRSDSGITSCRGGGLEDGPLCDRGNMANEVALLQAGGDAVSSCGSCTRQEDESDTDTDTDTTGDEGYDDDSTPCDGASTEWSQTATDISSAEDVDNDDQTHRDGRTGRGIEKVVHIGGKDSSARGVELECFVRAEGGDGARTSAKNRAMFPSKSPVPASATPGATDVGQISASADRCILDAAISATSDGASRGVRRNCDGFDVEARRKGAKATWSSDKVCLKPSDEDIYGRSGREGEERRRQQHESTLAVSSLSSDGDKEIDFDINDDVNEDDREDDDGDDDDNDDNYADDPLEPIPGEVKLVPSMFPDRPPTVFFEYPKELGLVRCDNAYFSEPLGGRRLLFKSHWERNSVKNAFFRAGFSRTKSTLSWTASWGMHPTREGFKYVSPENRDIRIKGRRIGTLYSAGCATSDGGKPP